MIHYANRKSGKPLCEVKRPTTKNVMTVGPLLGRPDTMCQVCSNIMHIAKTTKASGVPVKVEDRGVLAQILGMM